MQDRKALVLSYSLLLQFSLRPHVPLTKGRRGWVSEWVIQFRSNNPGSQNQESTRVIFGLAGPLPGFKLEIPETRANRRAIEGTRRERCRCGQRAEFACCSSPTKFLRCNFVLSLTFWHGFQNVSWGVLKEWIPFPFRQKWDWSKRSRKMKFLVVCLASCMIPHLVFSTAQSVRL